MDDLIRQPKEVGIFMPDAALPYDNHSPLLLQKELDIPAISFDVFPEFFLPFFSILRRIGRVFAPIMSMPETAMDKNGSLVPWQNNIRFSGKLRGMQPVAEPGGVQKPSDDQFGLGILSPDPSHHPRSRCLINYIRHDVAS